MRASRTGLHLENPQLLSDTGSFFAERCTRAMKTWGALVGWVLASIELDCAPKCLREAPALFEILEKPRRRRERAFRY